MTVNISGAGSGTSAATPNVSYDVIKVSGIASKPGDQIYIYGKTSTQQGGGMLLGATEAAPARGPFSADAADYTFATLVPSNLYSTSQIVVYDASSNKMLSPTVTMTPETGTTGNIAVGFQVNNQFNIIGGTGNIAVGLQINNQVNIAVSSSNLVQGGAQTNINNAGTLAIGTAPLSAGTSTIGGSGPIGHVGAPNTKAAISHVVFMNNQGHKSLELTAPVNQSTVSNGGNKPLFLTHSVGSTRSSNALGGPNDFHKAVPNVLSAANTPATLETLGFASYMPSSGQKAHSSGSIASNAVSHLADTNMSFVHDNNPHAIMVMHALS